MSHVTHMNESLGAVRRDSVTSHVAYMNEPLAMSHESCHIYERVISHESCHIYERVITP